MKYRIRKHFFLLIYFFFLSFSVYSQGIIIKGKVTDAETGEGMPLVNVVIKSSGKGVVTDFDGFYSLRLIAPSDSLVAFYVGYTERTKLIQGFKSQIIDFQLKSETSLLEEVSVTLLENPAFPIMRKVIANKLINDKSALSAYEFESYTKNEISIDNISQKFREKRMMRKIVKVFDSLKQMAGEDGKPILPVFVSEALSDIYILKTPERKKEKIKAVKVIGVGFDETSFVSQLIGSSFQEYNFYSNWLTILNKQFISPISDGWQSNYHYQLADSGFYSGNWCYKITFRPKRPQDLAFNGSFWVADTSFALKQIDATVGKSANLNYIEKIKIQQELEKTAQGPWVPSKTRILINVSEISENSPGLLAKFYVSNKNFKTNDFKPLLFFDQLIEMEEDAKLKNDQYWDKNRHDSLTLAEKSVLKVIDSVRNMPLIKSYIDIINIAVNGYKQVGTFDVGPYLFLYSNNSVEGSRVRLGIRTNVYFSHDWILNGYGAYGAKDNKFKYGFGISRILSRKSWTTLGYSRKEDYEQVGVPTDNIENNIFLAAVQWGSLRGPYYTRQNQLTFQTTFKKDFTQKITFKTKTFEPHSSFDFNYYDKLINTDTIIYSQYKTSEIILETKYAKDELFVQRDLDRISLGTKKWPVFTFRYSLGLKGILNSDFNYHKIFLGISHNIKLGLLGELYYDFNMGRVFSQVPYPLLEVHMGNQSPYYTPRAFNLMNYFEFISDTYVSIRARQYFEGLLFNRIPLIKRLKWRFLMTGNIVIGTVSNTNFSIIPSKAVDISKPAFYTLKNGPYAEVGYGIENIFKVLRIDFFHRLTYLNNYHVRPFGVKLSLQFKL